MLDLFLTCLPVVIVTIVCVKSVFPLTHFDLSKPPPPPPSLTLSLLAFVATLGLLVRAIVTGKPLFSIFFTAFAVVSMGWSCRIAARMSAQHEDDMARWRELHD